MVYTHKRYTINVYKMADLFDNTIICKDCGRKMVREDIVRNGCSVRFLECKKCGQKIYHPEDVESYKRFNALKNRQFHVKLRMVGNSYAVSIPHELINFFSADTEDIHRNMEKRMERMVTLAMEEMNKVALMFGNAEDENVVENEPAEKENHKMIRLIKIKKKGRTIN